MGDEVLLDAEHTPLPLQSLSSPHWKGPFKGLALRLILTALNCRRPGGGGWRAFDESNVESLRPSRRRATEGAAVGPAGPGPWYRSCSSSISATACPIFSFAGPAATRLATRGSRSTA